MHTYFEKVTQRYIELTSYVKIIEYILFIPEVKQGAYSDIIIKVD